MKLEERFKLEITTLTNHRELDSRIQFVIKDIDGEIINIIIFNDNKNIKEDNNESSS